MPTALRYGPYRFYFYANDRDEPRHVHVERDNQVAKFWLAPTRLHSSGRMSNLEIRRIARIIDDHEDALVEAWDGRFDG